MGEGEGLAATARQLGRAGGPAPRPSPAISLLPIKKTQHQSDASDGIFTDARKD